MLFNATHKLTSSPLAQSPGLLDDYLRYKRNTRGILAWFQKQGPTPDKPTTSMTIKDLESLVEEVSKNLTTLPDVVHFYFREAIADRKKLNKYYRTQIDDTDDNADSVSHEYFTSR
jgi:hypothetical protein